MATKKNGDKRSGGSTPKKGRGNVSEERAEPLSTEALLSQIDGLRRQLADERVQRRTLIETNNMLTRMLHAGGGTSAMAVEPSAAALEGSEGPLATAAATPHESFAATAAAASDFVPCGLERTDANRIVIGTIVGVGSAIAGVTLDTKLGPDGGLGWDMKTKENAFGVARHLVGVRHSCLLLGQPADFADLKAVKDMVKYVQNNSVS